jgi:flagellin-like hook-associated protein FlgL
MDALSRLNADAALLRARLDVLGRQASSGRKTDRLGDLQPEAPQLVNLSNDMARREVYGRAIDQSAARISVTQASLQRLKDIAGEFRSAVTMRLDANNPSALAVFQGRARAAALEVGNLLNTQMSGEYLFGGSDLTHPPVPNPQNLMSTGMAVTIATAIGGLNDSNAGSVAATTLTVSQDRWGGNSPFSYFLEDPARGANEARRSVPVADNQLVVYGVPANRNAVAQSTGETTGSWARDLLRGLFSVAALGPAQAQYAQGFGDLANTLREGFVSAETALSEEMGALGHVAQQLDTTKSRHRNISDILQKQIADITDVDMAATLTQLQGTRTALEASYRVTSSMADLTLSKFLR